MKIGNKQIKYFIAIVIAYSLLPIFSRAWSAFLTTYSYMLFVALIFLFIVLARGQDNLNHYAWVLAPFIGWCVLQYFVTTESVLMYGYQQLLFILPVICARYLNEELDLKFNKILYKLILFCLCCTAITTVIGLARYPDAARWLATAASSQDEQAVQYSWMNIGGYNFIYILLLAYPAVILLYKKQKLKKSQIALFIILVAVTFYEAEYTTALLLFMVSTVLLFLKKDLRGRGLAIYIFAALIACILLSDLLSNFLIWLASVLGQANYTERLNALAGGTSGLMASEDDRLIRYLRSWHTFLEHPLLGTFLSGGGGIGGHSFILDALGQFGILGAALLFFMYKRIYILFYKPYQNCEGFGLMMWGGVQTIFLSAINTGMWLPTLCLYIPIICARAFEVTDYEDIMDCEFPDRTVGGETIWKG